MSQAKSSARFHKPETHKPRFRNHASPALQARARPAPDRANLYTEITDRIIAELEAGRIPWVQPWGKVSNGAALGLPQNAASKRCYSGINILILWGAVTQHGFSSQNWLTFRQALALGGNVRKGEHGVSVVYADSFTPDDERRRAADSGETPGTIAFLKRFTVFNVDQCERLPQDLAIAAPPPPPNLILPRVDELIKASGMDFRIGGDRAYYNVVDDYVKVPPPQAYFEPINWHRTALHECSHSAGSAQRLNRDLSGTFGSKLYIFEELVAELSAAFVCAALGIVPTVRHADYIGAWIATLRDSNRAIVRAASLASKTADYLLGFLPQDSASESQACATSDLNTEPA
ncbi:MAG: zincin-like metallopeptidase domain-containing protein [Acidocella sp.]|nr:zincin-like metallopeptidase domain-containing protein [Acidocella sp.]